MAREFTASQNGGTSGMQGSRMYVDYSISTNEAGNFSDVFWAVGVDYGDPDFWHNLSDGKFSVGAVIGTANPAGFVWIANGFYFGTTQPPNPGGLNQLASGSFRITHDASGQARGAWYVESKMRDGSYVASRYFEFDLPTIPRQPSAPGTPTVTGHTDSDPTTATISWTAPSDVGAGLTQRHIQISRNSEFTDLAVDSTAAWGTSFNATGLAKGTAYWTRVRAASSAGFGPFSGVRQFTTGTTVPSAPPQPTVASITSTTAVVSWTAPADPGGTPVTGYDVQRATDSGFTQGVVTVDDSASPNTLAGLLPATSYWVRVRAKNAAGTGPFSSARQFVTTSRVKVGDGTQWKDARVYVGNGSSWVPAVPHVGNGSAWI